MHNFILLFCPFQFSQNKHLKNKLFSTYPKLLVEASPYDTIWGLGLTCHDVKAFDESTWTGLNLLGHILTHVRDELMYEAGIIPIDKDVHKVIQEAIQ